MEKLRFISSLSLVALLFSSLALADSWPSWRGDLQGSGKAGETSAPTDWGKKSDNIRWRVELPQRGNSTPIVSGDRIFVSQAIDTDKISWADVLQPRRWVAALEERRDLCKAGNIAPDESVLLSIARDGWENGGGFLRVGWRFGV